jgi:hypothetical protein
MRAQTSVRIADKRRHIIRCVVKYQNIARSVAVQVTNVQIVADPKIFQDARTGLCSNRLEGPVPISQSRSNQICAEGFLLQDHSKIEQSIPIQIAHIELVGPGSANDRTPECEVSVAWKYTHTV